MKSRLEKRGKVWWYASGSRNDRIRKSLGTGNKHIAEERQRALDQESWIKENCPGIYIQELLDRSKINFEDVVSYIKDSGSTVVSITLQKFAESWLDGIEFKTPKTEKTKRQRVKTFISFFGKDVTVDQVTATDVNGFLAKLLADNYAESTRQSYLTVIKEFFSVATERYNLPLNPAKSTETTKIKVKATPKDPISGELLFKTIARTTVELYRKLSKLHPKRGFTSESARKDQAFWSIMAYTGVAPIDASSLQPGDFENFGKARTKVENNHSVSVYLVRVKQLLKFGDDIFGIWSKKPSTRDSQIGQSRERFKILTDGWTFKAIRLFYLNELEEEGANRKTIKGLVGHSENSLTADKYYLRGKESEMKQASQSLADKYDYLREEVEND